MRKIILFMSLSLDGFFEGPDHDISWHNVDDEFNKYAIEQLKEVDTLVYGRRTYQLMEASWPKIAEDPTASEEDLEIARLINHTSKIVFSRTLREVKETENWRNVKLVHSFDPDEFARLKGMPGGDIGIGGSDLAVSFIRAGLIDEFRFMMTPVVLGEGTPIFKGLGGTLDLELVSSRLFASGNVLLRYRPARKR